MTAPRISADDADTAALHARIDELQAENARLVSAAQEPPREPARPSQRRGGWRPFVSAVCIVLASVIVPVSIVGAWARAELVDPDRFVATFGPLVDDEEVQELLIDQVSLAIDEQIDVEGVTNDLFDGIEALGLPPRAVVALDLLRAPVAQGAQNVIDESVSRLVESEVFADIWDRALRASHRGLVAAATGGESGAVSIDDEGVIGIQLGPIVEEVKSRLLDRGVGLANAIPTVDRTIAVAQSDALVTVRVVYGIAVTVGWWLPFVALALFVAGLVIARRRSTALLGSGVGLAFGAATLAIGLGVGGTVVGLAAAGAGVSSGALGSIYSQVIGAMLQTAVVVTVAGVIIALLAWVQGRWRGAVATRGIVSTVNDSIREGLASRGMETGRFGRWMDRQRVLVRVIIAVLAILWLALLRPLGVGEVFLVVLVALLAWWLSELSRHPSPDVAETDQPILEEEPDAVARNAGGPTEL